MHKQISPSLFPSEDQCVHDLLSALDWRDARALRVRDEAIRLIETIRKTPQKTGSIESFFQQYSLNTNEGLALMCLAEAFLRVPDGPTAKALIRDKVAGTNWLKTIQKKGQNSDWMTQAAGLGLSMSSGTMNSLFSKLGEPLIQQAVMQAMNLLGSQFVLGENINSAITNAQVLEKEGYHISYDMLGEGARTSEDAKKYFENYLDAIEKAGKSAKKSTISVKLSALHPRYEFAQSDICIPEISKKLLQLCEVAAAQDIPLTVDAEEYERLEISLKIIETVCAAPELKGWEGFGLALAAYQKTAVSTLDHILGLGRTYERKLQVRLVKGAYWDSEIKRAQVKSLPDYPVYTRKSNTDLSYLVCAQKLLQNRKYVYPMFGTHNAYSVAAILDMAGDKKDGFEFQKLFGMGNALYADVLGKTQIPVRVYAPVGVYEELLPYLVRRLLENGANSSFVNRVFDANTTPSALAADPVQKAQQNEPKSHPKIPLPENIYGQKRKGSRGLDLSSADILEELLQNMRTRNLSPNYVAAPMITGKAHQKGVRNRVFSPADRDRMLGHIHYADEDRIVDAFKAAKTGHQVWSQTRAEERARILEKIANALEENRAELMVLCVEEAGKTIPDALAEVREAVDFCRYYAQQGRALFKEDGTTLQGPTGENNVYSFCSRGIFVCISPWNFPLAIFTGQIAAALMAGNAVIAKPAEQTSVIAMRTCELMLASGLPKQALTLLLGDWRPGAALVDHPETAGVAFTGSTETAWKINTALAAKKGPIVPLIAETGGQNAMIMDSSALTEQVVDDVVLSAFGSAGQRCSACRVLYVQEEVADKTIHMLQGAMAHLRVGDPREINTDIGPVIDEQALAVLQKHKTALEGFGKKIAEVPLDPVLKKQGSYFSPIAYEIPSLNVLKREIFGPVLHVIRYSAEKMDDVIEEINASGYGLTFGVHSRIDSFSKNLAQRINAGNIYINRSIIGAVVGVQPFGGRGLSGTGPKAGGPNYLQRFANEKVVSVNTTAAGGNTSLVMLKE